VLARRVHKMLRGGRLASTPALESNLYDGRRRGNVVGWVLHGLHSSRQPLRVGKDSSCSAMWRAAGSHFKQMHRAAVTNHLRRPRALQRLRPTLAPDCAGRRTSMRNDCPPISSATARKTKCRHVGPRGGILRPEAPHTRQRNLSRWDPRETNSGPSLWPSAGPTPGLEEGPVGVRVSCKPGPRYPG